MSSRNPFFDDDNDASYGGGSKASNTWNDWEDLGKESSEFDSNNDFNTHYQSKQMEIDRRKQNMIDSTHRSMGMMYETEQVGNETAAELLHQGEQLRRVDQKLDKMDTDLDTSKRHITSIKSVFGGIVNYFNKSKPKQEAPPEEKGPSKLHQYVEKAECEEETRRERTDHPAMRIRGIGSDNDVGSWGSPSGYGGSSSSGYGASSTGAGSSGYQQSAMMREFDNQLDTNLDDISLGLGRLKGLAMGLNDELEHQNDYIDRIATKTERVDVKLTKTDKDVKKILRS